MVLNDGISGVLHKITNALDVTLNAFEQVQRASGNAVDTEVISQARRQLAGARVDIQNMADGYRRAAQEEERLNENIRSGSNLVEGMTGKVRNLVAAIGAGVGLQKLIGLSDQMTSTTARLSFIVDDGGSVDELEKKIMASAQRSRAAYLDTASAIASMGANAKSAFGSNDELIAFMEQINKQFVIGGASAEGQAAAMLQLTQAMAAGALRGEELNSILENAPGIARIIEQYMGIAEGSIKNYAQEGKVTAQVVKNAMLAAADETNAAFEKMPKTWAQIWTDMQNKALSVFSPILEKINEIGNSDQFNTALDGLMNALAVVASLAATVFEGLVTGVSWVAQNWDILAPAVLAVAAALAIYNGYLFATNALELISNVQKGIAAVRAYAAAAANTVLSAAERKEAMAKASETAAQYGFNAALLACPITWIILAIIAVIALLYSVVAVINHVKGTTISATGIICGVFMTALAFIGNLFVSLYNAVVQVFVSIYNLVAAVANFIGNVFNDPIGAVARLFRDLADIVLGILQTLASAIDNVFGTHLANGVQGWRDSLGGWVDRKFGKGTEVMAKVSGDDLKLGRFEYGKAYSMGYNFGKNLGGKVSGLFDGTSGVINDPLGAYDTGSTLDNISSNTGAIANNTEKTANALEMSAEELRRLRDIAERNAINQYTTARIHIEMNNNNNINSTDDLDGIVEALEKRLEDAMIEVSEGVHI
jgi:tape measure domain-containing protein